MPIHHDEGVLRFHPADDDIMPAATDFGFLENICIHRESIPYARCSAPFDILLCDDLRRSWDFLYIVFRTRRGDDDFIKGVDGQLFGLCRYPP